MQQQNFVMSIAELIEFHKILESKLARTSTEKEKTGVTKQMDVVWALLSGALYATVNEALPVLTQALNASWIDRESLALVVGEERVKAIPQQGIIPFQAVEDAVIVEEENSPELSLEEKLKKEVSSLLKTAAVRNIPVIAKIYKDITGESIPEVRAFIKAVGETPEQKYVFKLWAMYLAKCILTEGIVKAFVETKKYVPMWSDLDVAVLLHHLINEGKELCKDKPDIDFNKIDLLLNSNVGTATYDNIIKYDMGVSFLIEKEGLDPKDSKAIKARVIEIVQKCNTSSLTGTLRSQKYVEQGY